MKRLLFGIMIFASTLVAGLVATTVSDSLFENSRFDSPSLTIALDSPSEVAVQTEFTNLPNGDEVEYPEFNEYLLDISNNGDIFSTPEDLTTRSGEKWLSLNQTPKGTFTLRSSAIQIRQISSKEMDNGLRRVSFKGSPNPIFALRRLESIKAGDVHTLHFDPTEEIESEESELMEEGFRREFKLNDTTYVLRVSRGTTKDGETIAILLLSDGHREQVIDRSPIWPDSTSNLGHLIWAGDLDKDGKLDLYIDRSLGEEKSGTGLFLSSHATSNNIINMVALFGHTGC